MGRISSWAEFPTFLHPNLLLHKDICWKYIFCSFLEKILCIDCIPSGSWYTCALYLFEDHKQKRTNSHFYRVHKDIALHFNEGWQQTALSFLLAAVSSSIICYFHWFCLLRPWTLFLLCVERLTQTVSLTWRLIPTALSATLWSRDHSTVFHLTHFRTASTLPAAGYWRSYCLLYGDTHSFQSHFNTPFQNASEFQDEYLFWSSKISFFYNTPPFRSVSLVAGHWGLKGWIAGKIEILHGIRLETEWWMDR